MFLFARELTGQPRRRVRGRARVRVRAVPHRVAAAPAGAVVGVAAVRAARISALSSRPAATARRSSGRSAAWVAQNLSCGYYSSLLQPGGRRRTSRGRSRCGACGRTRATVARSPPPASRWRRMTVPFMLPYLALRDLGFSPRAAREVDRFAADVYSYLTAAPNLRVWGGDRARVAEARRRALSGTDDRRARGVRVHPCAGATRDSPGGSRTTAVAIAARRCSTRCCSAGRSGCRCSRSRASARAVARRGGAGDDRARWLTRESAQQPRRWFDSLPRCCRSSTLFAVVDVVGDANHREGPRRPRRRPVRAVLPIRPGLRRPPRAEPVRDGRRVRPRRRSRRLASPAIGDERRRRLVALVAGALIVDRVRAPCRFRSTATRRPTRAPDLAPLPDILDSGAGAPPVYRFIASLPAISRDPGAAARRAGVRHPLHVLFDAALEAAGQRLQRRRAVGLRSCSDTSLQDVAHVPTARGRRWSTPRPRTSSSTKRCSFVTTGRL